MGVWPGTWNLGGQGSRPNPNPNLNPNPGPNPNPDINLNPKPKTNLNLKTNLHPNPSTSTPTPTPTPTLVLTPKHKITYSVDRWKATMRTASLFMTLSTSAPPPVRPGLKTSSSCIACGQD